MRYRTTEETTIAIDEERHEIPEMSRGIGLDPLNFYPLIEMEVGQSFTLEEPRMMATMPQIVTYLSRYDSGGRKYVCRKVGPRENRILRVWRVA